MINVTIYRMKNVNWQLKKIDDEIFEYIEDEDINEFAKKIIDALFKISQDSDEIHIKYRSHLRSHNRDHIKSNSIRHSAGMGIMESRILEDLNLVLKKDE